MEAEDRRSSIDAAAAHARAPDELVALEKKRARSPQASASK
jgi:hypothetical protein